VADLVGPIQFKRGTSAAWASAAVPLAEGEMGIDLTLMRVKIGDGATLWPALPWATADSTTIAALQELAENASDAVGLAQAIADQRISTLPWKIIIAWGQSNESSQGTDYTADPVDARIFAFPTAGTGVGTIVPAQDPIGFGDGSTGLSPALVFARRYAAANPGVRVLIVPAAWFGTGFYAGGSSGNRWLVGWTPGTGQVNLTDRLVSLSLAARDLAKQSSPAVEFAALVGIQGESDASASIDAATYAAALDGFVAYVRTALGAPKLPVVLGQMIPESLVGATSFRLGINAVHIDTPRRLLYSGFAYGASGFVKADGGTVHYTAGGQRINGLRRWDAYLRALANVPGVLPLPPRNVRPTLDSGTLRVEWDAPAGRVTSYVVQTRGIDSGDWTTESRTVSATGDSYLNTVQTRTGIPSGSIVEVRIASVNELGQSEWANVVLVAATDVPTPAVSQTGAGQVAVSWAANPLAQTYRVDYKLASSSTWTLGTPQSGTSKTITGLSAALHDFRLMVSTTFGSSNKAVQFTLGVGPLTGTFWRVVSLRVAVSGYTGPLVRVRRASDNVETDISATSGGGLDLAALITASGGGDAFVVTWYDQTGNGRHFTQSTAAAQPKIVESGAVLTVNGKPAVRFDGVDDVLVSTAVGAYNDGSATFYTVAMSPTAPAQGGVLFGEGRASSSVPYYRPIVSNRSDGRLDALIRNDASTVIRAQNGTGYLPAAFTATGAQITVIDSGSNLTGRLNGAQLYSEAYTRPSAITLDAAGLGANPRATTPFWTGLIAEFAEVHAVHDSTTRGANETNQKAYAGTP